MRTGGVVLAGGRSSRMGRSKAALEWHGSSLLRHVAGIVERAVDGPVVVVHAPGQPLPPLPAGLLTAPDPSEGLGPLNGIATGLACLAETGVDVAFVAATDMPFLHPAYVRCVTRAAGAGDDDGTVDVVLPCVRGHRQPLAAAYRTSLASVAAELVAAGQLRPAFLVERARTRVLSDDDLLADRALAAADPDLDSVRNLNHADDYALARDRPAPAVTVAAYGVPCGPGDRRRLEAVEVRAATVGAAADAVGVPFGAHVLAAVNGDQTGRDASTPLANGDAVAFVSAVAGG